MSFNSAQIAAVDSALLNQFGTLRDYTFLAGGPTVSIISFFQQDNGAQQLGETVVWMHEPVLTVLRADVPDPKQGDTIVIDAKTYRVKEYVSDEGGLVHCLLERITDL